MDNFKGICAKYIVTLYCYVVRSQEFIAKSCVNFILRVRMCCKQAGINK